MRWLAATTHWYIGIQEMLLHTWILDNLSYPSAWPGSEAVCCTFTTELKRVLSGLFAAFTHDFVAWSRGANLPQNSIEISLDEGGG